MEIENTDDAIMHLTDSKVLQFDFGAILSKAMQSDIRILLSKTIEK